MAKHGTVRPAGKRGRAVSVIGNTPTAREPSNRDVVDHTSSPAVDVPTTVPNDNLVDLYSVGHEEVTREMCDLGIEVPFQHTLQLLGPQGEIVRVSALFDGCAMVSAMCATVFEKVKHRLGTWEKSAKQLRMGNGTIIPSLAVWKGSVQLEGVTVKGEFEVFNSGGSWAFLLGKPLLRAFQAEHAYKPDTVSICGSNNEKITLYNEIKEPRLGDREGVNLTLDVKQRDAVAGGSSKTNPPPREVPQNPLEEATVAHTDPIIPPALVAPVEAPHQEPESLLMRDTNPHKPERVARIIQEVTIGPDVTQSQRQIVHDLLKEYADCFALSIKESMQYPEQSTNSTFPRALPSGQRYPRDLITQINALSWMPKSTKCWRLESYVPYIQAKYASSPRQY